MTLPDIKPMLASPPKREVLSTLVGSHVFDLKLDGVRVLLYWDGTFVRLVNRSGIDVTNRWPEITDPLDGLPPMILDGEMVAVSGSFQDTAKRDKQNKPADVRAAMVSHPAVFITFDLLHYNGLDMRPLEFQLRRGTLEAISTQFPNAITTSVISADPAFFDQVKAKGLEGVIAKRITSTYKSGRFSDWIKFKAVRSITAIGIGYEAGTGARADFGAMFLALLDGNDLIEIGRVGTGFKAADITELKDMMDAGVPPLVEIECLNKSKDGKLRFPVYKGLRSAELSLADARYDQLLDIPTM